MCCRRSWPRCSNTSPIIAAERSAQGGPGSVDARGARSVDTPRIAERACDAAETLAGVESALLRRVYAGRGVRHRDELDYRLTALPHFGDLAGVDAACELLGTALREGGPIRVVGDFDADGATSTALVCDVLAQCGARVDYFIPDRARHGYGLSPAVVAAIGPPANSHGVLLTVDNGIAGHAGVESARAAGWRVVVCDHHLPGDTLPAADAIVDPNQPGCGFEGKALAGVGVAFYLMAALRARRAAEGAADLPRLADYLDLVAIGTVADVVPLDRLNRTLVSQGLARIRCGRTRPGVVALMAVAGREAARLDAADIGFALGPRLNAAGRLEDMGIGVECLRARDAGRAQALAAELAAINRQRQSLQADMQSEAEAALEAADRLDTSACHGLTVYDPGWHEGVVGLVAARLRERRHRPVVAFAPGAGGQLKGSARSIPGLHIRDVLARVDAQAPGVIAQFGGHAQAAGLVLAPERLEAFAQAFDAAVAERLTPAMATRTLLTDGELTDAELSLATAQILRDGGPWGKDFEEPLFHGLFVVVDQRIVGEKHLKLTVQPSAGRRRLEAMCFNRTERLETGAAYRLVYRLAVNTFREQSRANLIVTHLRPAD